MAPLVRRADAIVPAVLAPLRRVPEQPLQAAHFALPALRSAEHVANVSTANQRARCFPVSPPTRCCR